MTRKSKGLKKPLLWWALGFISAMVLAFFTVVWMASSVYSELPSEAKLGADFQSVDVIVCLAGGRGRIRKALELFDQGYGKILYISGIDKNVSMKSILRQLKWIGPIDERRIFLESVSTNTIQNAHQVSAFIQEQKSNSMLLVTSVYHARRSHFIFRKILPPSVRLEISWYESEPFDRNDWWKDWNGIGVTVEEFFKFFYAYLRLAA